MSNQYTPFGDVTAQTTAGVLERTYPGYDANGNRISQTDTLASPSSFAYDPLNRLDTASGPFGTRDYDYDPNGNRTQLMADTVTTALTYTPNSNRLATLGATNVLLDATGNTLNQGNWTYSYTPHNRLTTATQVATLKAGFAYNGLGQRMQKTDASAGTGRYYLYGLNGELLAETDQDGNVLREYLYLNGTLLALFEPDDDQDGFTNQQEAQQGTLPLNADSDGDSLTNLSEWFQYGTDSQNPDSDGDGIPDNVEIASHTNPNLPGSAVGDGDVNHDGQINLGDLVLLYQYVLGVKTPDADTLTHGDMNLDGQLNTPDLLLLQKLLLQSFFDVGAPSSGAVALNRNQGFWGGWLDRLIPPAQAFDSTNNGVLYYVHNDVLGTPQALTDEAGTVVWAASYDPFGKATVNEDPDNNGNSVTLNVRFPGQYYDQETGLHYNYYRYYDPATGRYITSDPIGLRAGPNTYAYAYNNPLYWVDIFGLDATQLFNRDGGRSAFDGPTNGNWGGKNWSGGSYSGDGRPTGPLLPTDSADECYMNHDICYESCENQCSGNESECRNACDRDLLNCLRKLPRNPRNWPDPPRPGTEKDSNDYRDWADYYFR